MEREVGENFVIAGPSPESDFLWGCSCSLVPVGHSEPASRVSPLVTGSRAPRVPVGNICVEDPPPPLGIFLLDNHCMNVSCSISSPGFMKRKWSLFVHSCGLAQSCNAASGADSTWEEEIEHWKVRWFKWNNELHIPKGSLILDALLLRCWDV